jgi:Asp-tRNA(Asn)/Glu-tRNA(Gln) amidotransferase B subunit
MTENQRWQVMGALMPPEYLAAIITRIADGTINRAGAQILFNTVYEQNRAKLAKAIEEQA